MKLLIYSELWNFHYSLAVLGLVNLQAPQDFYYGSCLAFYILSLFFSLINTTFIVCGPLQALPNITALSQSENKQDQIIIIVFT